MITQKIWINCHQVFEGMDLEQETAGQETITDYMSVVFGACVRVFVKWMKKRYCNISLR